MKKTLTANDINKTKPKPPRKLKRRKKVEEPKPEGKKRGFYLRSALDIRRLLSRLMNEAYQAKIEESLLRTISYSSTVFLKSVEVGDFEKRLLAVEARLDKRETKKKGLNPWPKHEKDV